MRKGLGKTLYFLLPVLCFQAAGKQRARGFLDDGRGTVCSTSDAELTGWVSEMGQQEMQPGKLAWSNSYKFESQNPPKMPTDQGQ